MSSNVIPLTVSNQSAIAPLRRNPASSINRRESVRAGRLMTKLNGVLEEPAGSVYAMLGHIMTRASEPTDAKVAYPISDKCGELFLTGRLFCQTQLATMSVKIDRVPELTRVTTPMIESAGKAVDAYMSRHQRQWHLYYMLSAMHLERGMEQLGKNGWDRVCASEGPHERIMITFEKSVGGKRFYRLYLSFRSMVVVN